MDTYQSELRQIKDLLSRPLVRNRSLLPDKKFYQELAGQMNARDNPFIPYTAGDARSVYLRELASSHPNGIP